MKTKKTLTREEYLGISSGNDNSFINPQDTDYSILGSIARGTTNTVLGAGALMGNNRVSNYAKKALRSRAIRFSMNKVASGGAGVVANRLGMEKNDVKGLIDGAGQLTGVTKGIHQGFNKGFGTTKLGTGIIDAGKGVQDAVGKGTTWVGNKFDRFKQSRAEAAAKRTEQTQSSGSGVVNSNAIVQP